jgi:hypothetical protein
MKKGCFRLLRRQFPGRETRILCLELQTQHDGRADQSTAGSLGPVVALPRLPRRKQPQDENGNRPQQQGIE